MRHSKAGIAAFAAAVLAGVAPAPQAQAKPMMSKPAMKSGMAMKGLNQMDKDFLKTVNGANLSEIAYNPTVQKKASAASAKQFALKMVADHGMANKDLVKLAASKHVALPHKVPAKEADIVKRLGRETGSKFDKAYQHEMIRDHTADVGEFKREISLGRDASVKAYAVKYLPVIQHHLMMAKTMLPPVAAKMSSSHANKMATPKMATPKSSGTMMKKK